jgi:integrase
MADSRNASKPHMGTAKAPPPRSDGPVRLAERLVKDLPAPERGSLTLWDTEVTGFGVRVFAPTRGRPEGARSFFLNYRLGGRERRITIGRSRDWSVEAARSEARELRRRVDRGEDPASERREHREAPTVKDLVDRYVDEVITAKYPGYPEGLRGPLRARANDEKRMIDEAAKRIGLDRKIADIHFGDIQKLQQDITRDGRPVRANRILAITSKAFSLTLRPRAGEAKAWRDHAAGNPCKGVARNPEEGNERFFAEAEIAMISDALAEYPPTPAANCIRFIMLTGCRPNEAMLARWEQLDGEPGYWVKPSSHTKQRRVHKAPLSPAAIELVEGLRKTRQKSGETESPWLFPGQKAGSSLQQLWHCWHWVRERASVRAWAISADQRVAKVVNDLRTGLGRDPTVRECLGDAKRRECTLPPALLKARIYDLRHTFASVGAGRGLSLQIIGKLLGHTQARTTQRYAHLADDPLREAADKIGAVISGAGR